MDLPHAETTQNEEALLLRHKVQRKSLARKPILCAGLASYQSTCSRLMGKAYEHGRYKQMLGADSRNTRCERRNSQVKAAYKNLVESFATQHEATKINVLFAILLFWPQVDVRGNRLH